MPTHRCNDILVRLGDDSEMTILVLNTKEDSERDGPLGRCEQDIGVEEALGKEDEEGS